jgi:hypothetical protein
MPVSPAFAIKKCLDDAKLTIDDIQVIEINEAFACVPLVSLKLLSNERFLKSDYKAMRQEAEFTNEETEYRSQRHILSRTTDPEKIIEFITSKLSVAHIKIHQKGGRGEELIEAKALFALFMRGYCNARCADICRVLGSISQGRASTLCSYGLSLMDTEKYRKIAEEFLEKEAS